jgi:hydroxymethylpyrimidine pyrophosphatase-like HAD family hydrolase
VSHDLLGALAEEWLQAGRAVPAECIRLVLCDVDGVITRGEGQPAELDVLAELTAINTRAREDPLTPAITLCTGRQAPYVELMAQTLDVFLPCIFEHGAGLFFPRAFRYAFDPLLGADYAARLARLRAAIDADLLQSGRAFVQPGKEATMTLYPLGDTPVEDVYELACRVVPPEFGVARNVLGVEIRPRGVDKGLGLRRIAELLDLPPTQVAGIGDSDPDLSFLSLVGWSAAPANATPAVRAAVTYVSDGSFGRGLLEILTRLERRNRDTNARLTSP